MIRSVLFICFIVLFLNKEGVCHDTSGINFDNIPNIDKVKEKYSKIKTPDDVKAVREWKDDCEQKYGPQAVQDINNAPGELVECVLQYIKPKKIQREIEVSMKRGNLDQLFKKYCGFREEILQCVDELLGKVKRCLSEEQENGLNVTRRAVDAGIDFTCHDGGDRIALFMAEDGESCLNEHKDSIKACVEERVPEINDTVADPDNFHLDTMVINEENCNKFNAIHQCIVQETEKCEDPTPANILDALITAMLKVTPCYRSLRSEEAAVHSGGSSNVHSSMEAWLRHTIASIGPILCGFWGMDVPVMWVSAWILLKWAMIGVLGALCSLMSAAGGLVRNIVLQAIEWVITGQIISVSGLLVTTMAGLTAAHILI